MSGRAGWRAVLNLVHAVILGLVEGITEYLPISSTGHLILTQRMLGLDDDEASREAFNSFTIVVQGGAILAVAGLYWPRMIAMLAGLAGKNPAGLRLLVNLLVAFVPAAVLGFLLDDLIEAYLFGVGPVVAALIAGGVYMLGVTAWASGRIRGRLPPRPGLGDRGLDGLTPVRALAIGALQCVAMWPGTSRSMMTITGGMMVGLRPRAAAEFSFLLGLPTLTAATAYVLAKDLATNGRLKMVDDLGLAPVLVGMAVATVSAAVAVKWLVGFLSRHGLSVFGWYRIVLGVALLLAWARM